MDTAIESKFEDEPFPGFVLDNSDLCTCHDKPKGACSDYIALIVKFVQKIFKSGQSNQDLLQLLLPYSKLDVSFWRENLVNYFDGKSVSDAAEFGWDLGIAGDGPDLFWDWRKFAPPNHPSARSFPDQVDNYLLKEQSRGVLVGPLPDDLPFRVFVSPVGTVEKPGSTTTRQGKVS